MNEIKKRFEQLNDREKKLVMLFSILFICLMFYSLILAPLNTSIQKNSASIKQQTELLNWVKENRQKVAQLKASANNAGKFNGSLPQAINATARTAKIEIARMQPQGDELQIWVDSAAFSDVLGWLNTLENRGIRIIDVDLVETNESGKVKIRRLLIGKS